MKCTHSWLPCRGTWSPVSDLPPLSGSNKVIYAKELVTRMSNTTISMKPSMTTSDFHESKNSQSVFFFHCLGPCQTHNKCSIIVE